ncbi:MAG: AAA family ATPase [Paludibacteraceae bacterium]|nr:AAA family ATPase [Paludibacteraceae bacterium]
MLTNFIKNRIISFLPFVPNSGQETAINQLSDFLSPRITKATEHERRCFLLTGYAGTGKTSLVSALTGAMQALQQPTVLLAPTGRAAKVMSHYSGFGAYTIHKWIYSVHDSQCTMHDVNWDLRFNKDQNTLFIVDEASMISHELLRDLIQFVYQGEGCRLLLLGDDAQLPPVGYTESPALQISELESHGLQVMSAQLTEVARQADGSGILKNATTVRENLGNLCFDRRFAVGSPSANTRTLLDMIAPYADVLLLPPNQMVGEIERSYNEVGLEETLIITRSNKRTNLYNQGVRAQLLWKEDMLQTGDRVMVSRNNYFFTEQYKDLPFLANGDMLEVVRLRNEREIYGQHFADASLRSLDYDWEIDVVLWLDTLLTDSPEMNYALQRDLYSAIVEDYPEIRTKKEMREKIAASPYYNALQVRYAYAVTCHKSQGGQWKRVFIDPGALGDPNREETNDVEDLRWLYTALTRATEYIYILKNK